MLPSPTPCRILYVEDNDADAVVLAMALAEGAHQHTLTVLNDGQKAMEFISAKPFVPDLVILDVDLPFRDGVQVLEALRADPLLGGVAVVVFIDKAYPGAKRVEQFKPSLCTPKPLDLNGYLDLAKTMMELPSRSVSQSTPLMAI